MKKKSVLFMIASLDCGGAEKSLISLLQLLDYSKMDATLLLQSRGGIFEQYLPKSVKIIRFPKVRNLTFNIGKYLYSARLRFRMTRHWAETYWKYAGRFLPYLENEYDVAIAYNQGFPTYYIANKVKARRKLAWVNSDLNKAGYRVDFNSDIYKKFDYVCPVSDSIRDLIINQGYCEAKKTKVVYDILNVNLIRKMAKESVEIKLGGVKLVTVGRLMPPKNYPLAVETAKVLLDNGLNFHWWFVGGGNEKNHILTKAKELGVTEYITITGMTGNPYPYMNGADVYVQTSSFEGFCLTLNEARILNRPVVTTNFPPAYDQIKQYENGIITEMDSESLANAILQIVNDSALRDKLIEGTKREVNLTAQIESAKVNRLILD
ncbi:MAG: glycosyltransferase [Muribaculum sp.]|nr:glycosyltransferase [Muribaculum sp.]